MKLSLSDQDVLKRLYEIAEESPYVTDINLFKKHIQTLLKDKESPIYWQPIIIEMEKLFNFKR